MLLSDLTNNKKLEVDNGLYIVSTPIGNRYDITLRALNVLNKCSVVVCEDTRVTKKLFSLFDIRVQDKIWIAYNDHNGSLKISFILKELKKNKIISLVSDAGTPLISDPGYKLLQQVIKNKIKVFVIPGPSAITAALVISGAKTDNFLFLGFLPKNKYIEVLQKYSLLKTTLVVFEASPRIKLLIKDVFNEYLNTKMIIIKELTKIHEEVIRIDINNYEKYIKNDFKFKGELTIILELNSYKNKKTFSDTYLLKELKKYKPSKVASNLAKNSNQSREDIYKRCIGLTK